MKRVDENAVWELCLILHCCTAVKQFVVYVLHSIGKTWLSHTPVVALYFSKNREPLPGVEYRLV